MYQIAIKNNKSSFFERLESIFWTSSNDFNIYHSGVLHWTPTCRVGHQKFTSDDDDMILEYARKKGGVIVTRDQYRDSYDRCPEFKETIEKRYQWFLWIDSTMSQ